MELVFNKKNYLPRGGYLVPTSIGYIQFGSPPETIKDTMLLPDRVPSMFVLPGNLFHVDKGISVAELEFPTYYNHFLCGKKNHIICTEKQRQQLIIILQESVFGPQKMDSIANEFINGEDTPGFTTLLNEMKYFRGERTMEDLIEFTCFNESDNVQLGSITIKREENVCYRIYDGRMELDVIPWDIPYHIHYDISRRLEEPFQAPNFGITCLGPSHGFDPESNTSGFILWILNRGIMIDPPVDSTEWLRKSNVNPKLIDHVILTHCHADHDAGTFQKILEEFPVTIHTTLTVMESFLRKYSTFINWPESEMRKLFSFNPITIGAPLLIEGAQFIFHYTLHSIPTLGFRLSYQDHSFLYTSDHLNDPHILKKLLDTKVLSQSRYDFLLDFPWDIDTIYHEAGIPPIHTPIDYLASLEPDIQKKITVYHIARKDFPKDTHLKLAQFGIENTAYPEVKRLKYDDALGILDLLNHVDLFRNLPITKARDFLMAVQEEYFKSGDYIIRKNTPGNKLYIVAYGNVEVKGTEATLKKTYGKYEYFGESALVTNTLRSADVLAMTSVKVITIEKNVFLHLISSLSLEQELVHLAKIRHSNSWDILSSSKVFASLTSHQKTQLEMIMQYKEVKKNHTFVREGECLEAVYILITGEVSMIRHGRVVNTLQTGDFAGDIVAIQSNLPYSFTLKSISDVGVYAIFKDALVQFVQENPGCYMKLVRNSVGFIRSV